VSDARLPLIMAPHWTDRRVVITGLGTVSPLGHDPETFWKNVIEGKCGIRNITAFDASAYDCRIAAEVRDFDPSPAFPSPKDVRRAALAWAAADIPTDPR